ncbi:MAG: DinB family protein [Phycisphaerales bacterium]
MPSSSVRAELLAESIQACKLLLGRYLAGFNDVTHVRQTPDLPNHVAWCLGHTALTMHRVAEMLDGRPLPASDFVKGDGTSGSRDKGIIDSEAVAFGSIPEERHDRYPRLARCVEIYNAACDRLAEAVRSAPDARLDEMVNWGQASTPLRMLVIRMVFHNGFHTGEIADTRRALGFKSIFA